MKHLNVNCRRLVMTAGLFYEHANVALHLPVMEKITTYQGLLCSYDDCWNQ